ncbi:MFS transporter [Nocardia otitidiscaviarum]|uniref:Multidrug-efflux transporter 3 n=1 Tax=Nocardia otitidiscaviarum TaxID=1823 RepID=A0A378Y8T9_9NOCA|nr:MDR family MFS transporter [Nocardia otitidiscaviarum]MBF6131651.1 MFS transporter [Nocardia otitidiscaviarum]MBF6238306.1 MFS transporter [Nocardia otitidiscaviarum]MBF6482783.1 MFS transporter [Nocardia otitidiscaviarum]SUA73258.1 Multidrug-efflux transporter 3 [Nocardia otitidiscaviarum]
MTATEVRPDIGFRSERGPLLASLMLATSLVALDSTIIATAVLTITDQLGGFAQFPWLFSIYLLAQAVTVPIYGKLADMLGRKPVMLFGIAVFALGSLLCGLATSMVALIAFRAVQGIGAGAVAPMSMTIAGDVYTVAERAKVQGYLASVWAASSVLGPVLGGVFAEYVSWRWIFLINLPLAALAAWMLARHFTERATRQTHRIDYLGAALLTVGAGALILALLEGGHAWAWSAPTSLALFGGGALALVLFGLVERRAANPILPLWVFTRRVVVASSTVSLLIGAVILGLTSYVPTFAQGVLGTGALAAGLTVGALTMGWPLAASQAGKVYLRIGFRRTALIGSTLGSVGAATLLLVDADSGLLRVAVGCFIVGTGMGLVATPTLIAAQSAVDWTERGVVTATNMFARSLGSAVGVAVFGALVNSRVGGSDHPAPEALSPAIHLVFLAVAGMAVVMVAASAMMPRVREASATQ